MKASIFSIPAYGNPPTKEQACPGLIQRNTSCPSPALPDIPAADKECCRSFLAVTVRCWINLRGDLHFFCSARTFKLCTKNPFGFVCLGSSFIKQDEVYLPTRQFLNPSFSPPSLQLNCDEFRGILTECETGQYYNGTPPSKWLGSSPILQQWVASQCKPVRYGQCWVFAAVMCSGTAVVKDFCVEQSFIWSAEPLVYA